MEVVRRVYFTQFVCGGGVLLSQESIKQWYGLLQKGVSTPVIQSLTGSFSV